MIVPIAADRKEYENEMPRPFTFHRDGTMLCVKSIEGLELEKFSEIYFVILQKHEERYSLSELLKIQFQRKGWTNAKIVILDTPTLSQAETVYQTIKKMDIHDGVFIKDADGYFKCEITKQNGITIYPLDDLDFVDPKHKSYVQIDNQFYITNIIERKIIGRYFNAGGYLFDSADKYCRYYEKVISMIGDKQNHLCLSHIVYEMLLNKEQFRPFFANRYEDWSNEVLTNYMNIRR